MKKLFSTLSFGLIVLTIFTLAACGGSGSSSSASSTPGATSSASNSLAIAFLPKAINNPYFDTAASGGKLAATSLSGQFQQVGPSSANAAAQVPFITTLTEQHTGAIVISGDDPNAVAPALKQAMSQGVKVAYGNDDDQTSFNDTLALLQQYPNLNKHKGRTMLCSALFS